jgi:hypothetical protein
VWISAPGIAAAATSAGADLPPDGSSTIPASAPRSGPVGPGYAVVTSDGTVATFGGAQFDGDLTTGPPSSPVVGMAATADGGGYWLATASGTVFAFGDARGPARRQMPGPAPVAAIVADSATRGYWIVRSNGIVDAVSAPRVGAAPWRWIDGPVVAATADLGGGLWLATAGGKILSVDGAPPFSPTVPGESATNPVTSLSSGPGGNSLWVGFRSGRVELIPTGRERHGTEERIPSPGSDSPISALVTSPSGNGALVVRSNGAITTLGDAVNIGDARSPLHPPYYPISYQPPPTLAVGGAYLAVGTSAARTGPLRIAVIGDSLSVILGRDTENYVTSRNVNAQFDVGGIMGCGVAGDLPLATYSDPGPPAATLPACGQWQQQYRQVLASSHPNEVVVLLGYWESQLHLFRGRTVTTVDSSGYRNFLAGQLRILFGMVHDSGARLVVLDPPVFGDGTPVANVIAFESVLDSVSSAEGGTLIRLAPLIDPGNQFVQTLDGRDVRTADGVHLTSTAVETVIDPALLPQFLAVARKGRADVTADS